VIDRCTPVDGRVLLVAHGLVLRVLTAVCLGFAPADGARFALAPAGIGVIGHEHESRTLRCWDPDWS
jgi:broad specificity phosphatase PhoE